MKKESKQTMESSKNSITSLRNSFLSQKNYKILKTTLNDYFMQRHQIPYDEKNDVALYQMMDYEVQKVKPDIIDRGIKKTDVRPYVHSMNKHIIEQMISFLNKQYNQNKPAIPHESFNNALSDTLKLRKQNENSMILSNSEPLEEGLSPQVIQKRLRNIQKDRDREQGNIHNPESALNQQRIQPRPEIVQFDRKNMGNNQLINSDMKQMVQNRETPIHYPVDQRRNTQQQPMQQQPMQQQPMQQQPMQQQPMQQQPMQQQPQQQKINKIIEGLFNPVREIMPQTPPISHSLSTISSIPSIPKTPVELPNFSTASIPNISSNIQTLSTPGAEPSSLINRNDTIFYPTQRSDIHQQDPSIQRMIDNTANMSRISSFSLNGIPTIQPMHSQMFSSYEDDSNADNNIGNSGNIMNSGEIGGQIESSSSFVKKQNEANRFDKRELYARSNIIMPPRTKLVRQERYITIDSQDRNLQVYPQSTNFQVIFNPAGDSFENREVRDAENNLLYTMQVKYVGDTHNATIPSAYSNIYEIQCVNAMIPHSEMWVCGRFPYVFNGPRIDENRKTLYQFPSMPYGPIWQDDIGIPKNVLSEPYLILKIDELVGRGPYKGTNDTNTNAFAKLVFDGNLDHKGRFTQFIKMKTMANETYRYNPSSLGRLDRWTMKLQTNTGAYVNFGPDKSFVQTICPGNILTKGQTLKQFVGKCSTRITISKKQLEYTDVEGHCLIPGDKIFIYNTRPNNYIKFVGNIVLYELSCCSPTPTNEEILDLSNSVIPIEDALSKKVIVKAQIVNDKYVSTTKFLDFRSFAGIGNYFVMQYQIVENDVIINDIYLEYLKICGYDSSGNIITDKPQYYDPANPNQTIYVKQIGYAESNQEGLLSDNNLSLFSNNGWFVTQINPSSNTCPDPTCANENGKEHCSDEATIDPAESDIFELNYPYELLTAEYRENYYSNDFFFIKQRLQLSYTFRIVTLEKDPEMLEASIDN
jgi:hypothetical protein